MKRLIPLLFLVLLLGATPSPSPTVDGCAPAVCMGGVYFTAGATTGHRFAAWISLENDPQYGALYAFNDGGQFLGWCLLAGGPNFHMATEADLLTLGGMGAGWWDQNGKVQAEIPAAVRKMLNPRGGK